MSQERELEHALHDLESRSSFEDDDSHKPLDIQATLPETGQLVKRDSGAVAEGWADAHEDEIREIKESKQK